MQGSLTYEATQVDNISSWMIKRVREAEGKFIEDEALIKVVTNDPQAAIQAAIERGSWA